MGGGGGAACKATYHLGYAPVSHNVSCVYEAVQHLGGLLYQVALIGVVLQLIIYSRHTTTTTASLHHPHNPLLRCAALTPSDRLDGRLRSGGSSNSFIMHYVPALWLPDKSSPISDAQTDSLQRCWYMVPGQFPQHDQGQKWRKPGCSPTWANQSLQQQSQSLSC